MENYLTNSPGQTKNLGKKLAQRIIKKTPKNRAIIIGLEGGLGSGKTTFLQGFIKGLRVKQRLLSPTFIIFRRFKIKNLKFENFYHIDCYRLKQSKELLELGLREIISNPKNIVAIEWVEKVRKVLFSGIIFVRFEIINEKKRRITILF